jgi:hypothetical protein
MSVWGNASAATPVQIGSWVLSCPNAKPSNEPCLLRSKQRLFDKAGITGDLEIMAEGKTLLPVLMLRGLSAEMLMAASLAGTANTSMQFGGGPREALDCVPTSLGFMCLPRDDAARRLAAGLPAARSVTVRVLAAVTGMKPLPVQEKSLDLSGTNEALVRLRTAGPSQVPGPVIALASQSPGALMGMADKALKAAGYPNGVAELLAKYRGK